MLENCCYFREATLVHNMLRKGLFGDRHHRFLTAAVTIKPKPLFPKIEQGL